MGLQPVATCAIKGSTLLELEQVSVLSVLYLALQGLTWQRKEQLFAPLVLLAPMQALLVQLAAQVVLQESFLEMVPLHVLLAHQVQGLLHQALCALLALQDGPALAELPVLNALLVKNLQLEALPAQHQEELAQQEHT